MRSATRFSRADYDLLPEGFPAQLVRGQLVKEPAPTYGHQRVAATVQATLTRILGPDRVLPAPVDVPIGEYDVYQPDVSVFREAPPPEERCSVVPLLVVEIASPGTRTLDRGIKRRGYLDAGVVEVWLVDAAARTIEVHSRAGVETAQEGEVATSAALPGFSLDPAKLFGPGGPKGLEGSEGPER